MDREYLEDYQAKEEEEYQRLVVKKIEEGNFDFTRDKYPPNRRFVKLQRPVTDTTIVGCNARDRWNQVPFSGSTIMLLPAFPPSAFEECFFKISEIPKIIDFIKETGRIQIGLQQPPKVYEGFSYLDPLFEELEPPHIMGMYIKTIGTEKEIQKARDSFYTLAKVRFSEFYADLAEKVYGESYYLKSFSAEKFDQYSYLYAFLKLRYYSIAEEVENAMIDNPMRALFIFDTSANFLADPFYNLRFDSFTHSFKEIQISQIILGQALQPQEISFPCEVGKFLLKKLTYAPQGLRACNELIDHYDSYDLQKVHYSLNKAIVENHLDIIEKNVEELSEILDNVWNDKTIPRRIKGLKIGVPLSVAAIGNVVAGPIGAAGGLLAGLGFTVGSKFLEANTEGLAERIAKLFSRSYQANIYDFKKKYKAKIAHP